MKKRHFSKCVLNDLNFYGWCFKIDHVRLISVLLVRNIQIVLMHFGDLKELHKVTYGGFSFQYQTCRKRGGIGS